MTLRADFVGISTTNKLGRVRIVTISAGHTGLIHLALHERPVNIDFVEYLAVGEIQILIEQRQHVRVRKRLTVFVFRRHDPTT